MCITCKNRTTNGEVLLKNVKIYFFHLNVKKNAKIKSLTPQTRPLSESQPSISSKAIGIISLMPARIAVTPC